MEAQSRDTRLTRGGRKERVSLWLGGWAGQSAPKWDALQAMSSEHELQSIKREPYDRWSAKWVSPSSSSSRVAL